MLQDIRYALRMIRRSPGFSFIAVLTLALGISATTAIFSVVDAVLLHPLPYPDSNRIMVVEESSRKTGDTSPFSPANYLDLASRNTAFIDVAAMRAWVGNLTGSGQPQRVRGIMTTASLFRILRVNPIAGRYLLPQDEKPGNDHVVLLSHGLWVRLFSSDPNLIGKDIFLNGEKYRVVGVMPPQFSLDQYSELWLPSPWSVPTHPLAPDQDPRPFRDRHYLDVWGRLKTGITVEQAGVQLNTLGRALEKENPDSDNNMSFNIRSLHEDLVGNIRPALLVLFVAVATVLLIACANVANLLLARATGRSKEISIRTALGAGRLRLMRQLLMESIVLALLGGIAGVLIAALAVPSLLALSPDEIQGFQNIGIHQEVLAFSFFVSAVSGILFGLAPAFHASRFDLNHALKQGERGNTGSRAWLHSALVIAEISLSLVLLVGAGLLIKSFHRLMQVNPGFSSDHLLVFNVALPTSASDAEKTSFYRQIVERLSAMPGVKYAGAISRLPLLRGNSSRSYSISGKNNQSYEADIRVISPDYFRAMGIPLLNGRYFTEEDMEGPPRFIVVNEAVVRNAFHNQDPIGKRITDFLADSPNTELEIIGIVGNVRHRLEEEPPPTVYQPLGQAQWSSFEIVVKTGIANPESLANSVQRIIWSVNKDVPLANFQTMQRVVAASVQRRTFTVLLLSIFAVLAMALAAIGLYGVMSYFVSQRTQEIGIRLALGARREDVLRLVIGQGMAQTVLGIAIGIFGAFGLTHLLTKLLFGVSATDTSTFTAITGLLVLVALMANYIPARRASRIDPMVALRYE
jgi:putative ABC transport system permease protein